MEEIQDTLLIPNNDLRYEVLDDFRRDVLYMMERGLPFKLREAANFDGPEYECRPAEEV